jgi:hypothetical protein
MGIAAPSPGSPWNLIHRVEGPGWRQHQDAERGVVSKLLEVWSMEAAIDILEVTPQGCGVKRRATL